MHTKNSSGKNFTKYVLGAALLALVLCFVICNVSTAYAEGGFDDAFELVFPHENYFQSEQPTLVAANADYLTVYDRAQNRLYVRGKDLSTYYYDISDILTLPEAGGAEEGPTSSLKPVEGIYNVGSHALVAVGTSPSFEVYSIDLTDRDALPQKKDIPSPSRIYCFASDGERLYAKNATGNISIYEYADDLVLVRDDIVNDALAGKASIAGDGDKIYLFPTVQSVPRLYIYDSGTDELLLDRESKLVGTAYIGDVIYAQISPTEDVNNSNKVICLDKQTGDELYTSNFMPESFCAYGDKLYSIEGGDVTGYRFKQTTDDEGVKYTLEPEEILSMTSGDFKHLASPADIISVDGATIIADSDNMRVSYVAKDATSALTYDLGERPLRLAANSDTVYALLEGGDIACFDIVDDALIPASTISAAEEDAPKFVDITCLGQKLYATDGTSLYVCIGGVSLSLTSLEGAKRVTVSSSGAMLYALTDDGVIMLSENGDKLPTKLTGNFEDALDIAADYAGNIVVMYPDRAEYYQNNIYSLVKTSTHPLSPSAYSATATSCALVGDELYFSAEESFIGKFNIDAVTDEGYIPPALPAPDEDAQYHFARLKDGTSSYFLPAEDCRAERVVPASSNVLLVLDGIDPPADGLKYAMDGDKMYIIPAEDFEDVQPAALEGKAYKMKEDGTLYRLPYHDAGSVALAVGTQGIWEQTDCAGYDEDRFIIVSYDGKDYFVSKDLLEEDLAPPDIPDDPDEPQQPEEPKPLYGRAKAARVGGTVAIYSDMSETEVLSSVVDGKKVEILGTFDGYYQVRYGDIVGYMRAAEVKIGGLTTVQIVAIVLSVVVLLAGTGISLSIHAIKKRDDSEKEESDEE